VSVIDFLQSKKKLKVLILGAYRPDKALKRLEKLRNCLIENGFEAAKLAKDFPDDRQFSQDLDEHYTVKSRQLIEEWAQVPIFIYFKRAKNDGVTVEITYTCDKLHEKQSCCAVFFEGKLEDFSSQVKGEIKDTKKVSYEIFKNDRELCLLACGHLKKMLDRLFYYLG
jgi:hypothetical protein